MHPGGVGLRKQFDEILDFIPGEPEIILTSDMVPRNDGRRRKRNMCLQTIPKERLVPVIRVGFDICRMNGAREKSFSSRIAGLIRLPGTPLGNAACCSATFVVFVWTWAFLFG